MSSIFQIFMNASREFLVYKAAVGKSNQDSGPHELANLIHLHASKIHSPCISICLIQREK